MIDLIFSSHKIFITLFAFFFTIVYLYIEIYRKEILYSIFLI